MMLPSFHSTVRNLFSLLKSHYRVKRCLRLFRPYSPARPMWRRVVKPDAFPPPANYATKVLIASSTGSHWTMTGFESVLTAALKLRHASLDVLLCNGILPACQECDFGLLPGKRMVLEGTSALCGTCFAPAVKMFGELDVQVKTYGEYLSMTERQELDALVMETQDVDIPMVSWKGVCVGEHALAGSLRFFGCGSLDGEVFGSEVTRLYLRAALYTTAIVDRLLQSTHYDVAVFHHGIYVPQGVVGDVCRMHGVRVVNWTPTYRNRSFLFSHGNSYHKTMIDEPKEEWCISDWDQQKSAELMQYLESRRSGGKDWISFQRQNKGDAHDLFQEIGIAPDKQVIGLLTNVLWDAQLHFRQNAFPSMLDWLFFTIDHFSRREDVDLLIRVHPAEVLGTVKSRQRVVDEIRNRWPRLPKNIRIVPPEDPRNTYTLMSGCDSVLVYGTKMAIELPCWGIPVVVAGEAWARGKGFTTDVSSTDEYQSVLAALPARQRLTDEKIELARNYAYYFFFRRMIPVNFARKNPYLVPFAFTVDSLDDLIPGADPGLDCICEGILSGAPFVFKT